MTLALTIAIVWAAAVALLVMAWLVVRGGTSALHRHRWTLATSRLEYSDLHVHHCAVPGCDAVMVGIGKDCDHLPASHRPARLPLVVDPFLAR